MVLYTGTQQLFDRQHRLRSGSHILFPALIMTMCFSQGIDGTAIYHQCSLTECCPCQLCLEGQQRCAVFLAPCVGSGSNLSVPPAVAVVGSLLNPNSKKAWEHGAEILLIGLGFHDLRFSEHLPKQSSVQNVKVPQFRVPVGPFTPSSVSHHFGKRFSYALFQPVR